MSYRHYIHNVDLPEPKWNNPRVCQGPNCRQKFTPRSHNAKYCSRRCQQRVFRFSHRQYLRDKMRAHHALRRADNVAWWRDYYANHREEILLKQKIERQARLRDWIHAHPRCMICPNPIKRMGAVTCSQKCSKIRHQWFIKGTPHKKRRYTKKAA